MIGKIISHYKIHSKIGRGGMGVVYKAEDTKLKRTVALKFLPPELTRDPNAKERFILEAQAASSLEHNNICNIHEISETEDLPGVEGGQTFIVMACYEGETLKEKIENKPLKSEEAIDLSIQIAQGLEKAHKKDIVHRDIKPGNIFVTDDGVAKILDFGLAKLSGQKKLTQTISTVGTLAYISPEQLGGEEADHRSDIWSLGVVLYEMVTGHLPFKGDYGQAIMYAITNDEPEPLSKYRSDLPSELEQLIFKCLEKDKRLRYQHADDLLADLHRIKRDTDTNKMPLMKQKTEKIDLHIAEQKRKRLLLGSAAAVLLVIVIVVLFFIPESERIDSLAILPFINVSGQEDAEYLSDGIPESLISYLQKIPNLKVISFNAVLRRYKDNIPDPSSVGEELNVSSVAMGRMTLRGDNITINIEIIDTRDNSVILTHQYIEKLANLLDVQSRIGKDITDKLRIELTGEEAESVYKLSSHNPEAYTYYLRGRHFWYKRTPEDFKKAIAFFKRAIEIDTGYALAYSGLADTYRLLPEYTGISPYSSLPKAREAAEKALKLDNTLAETHTSIAGVLSDEGNRMEAKKEFERAIQLNPNYLLAYHWGAINLGWLGDVVGYTEMNQKALDLDPKSPIISSNLAGLYRKTGRIDKAIEQHKKAIRLNPDHAQPYRVYGTTLSEIGDHKKAIEMTQKALVLDSISLISHTYMGEVYRDAGLYDKAIEQYNKMIDINSDFSLRSYCEMGITYQAAKDYENAIAHFKKATQLDPIHLDAYEYMGLVYRFMGEYEKSVEQFRKMVEINPKSANGYLRYGRALFITGDHDTAFEQLKIAGSIDPAMTVALGYLYFHAREFDKSIEICEKVLELQPGNIFATITMYYNYLYQGDYMKGIPYFKEFLDMLDFPDRERIYRESFGDGIIDEFHMKSFYKNILEVVRTKKALIRNPLRKARMYTFIGEKDSAFTMLNKAYESQYDDLAVSIGCPFFDKLRSDSRYDDFIKKLKLEKYIKPLE
ncbi:tetratricopeptide repeat protein [Bacteroidota bacterium]